MTMANSIDPHHQSGIRAVDCPEMREICSRNELSCKLLLAGIKRAYRELRGDLDDARHLIMTLGKRVQNQYD